MAGDPLLSVPTLATLAPGLLSRGWTQWSAWPPSLFSGPLLAVLPGQPADATLNKPLPPWGPSLCSLAWEAPHSLTLTCPFRLNLHPLGLFFSILSTVLNVGLGLSRVRTGHWLQDLGQDVGTCPGLGVKRRRVPVRTGTGRGSWRGPGKEEVQGGVGGPQSCVFSRCMKAE